MTPLEKLALQLTIARKGLDVAQCLRRISPVENWMLPLGGEIKITSKPRHSWKDLRLCCHDLRPLYLPGDPLKRMALSGLLGPISPVNRRALDIGLRMLASVALLEDSKKPLLRHDINTLRLGPNNEAIEELKTGFVHNVRATATAYVYGQWAHGTRAVDHNEMRLHYGLDANFVRVTDFAYTAGQGLLVALVAFAEDQAGTELPRFEPKHNLRVDVPATVKKLKKLVANLELRFGKLIAKHPRKTHVLPI